MVFRKLFGKPTAFTPPTPAPFVAAIVLRAPCLPDESAVRARLIGLWPVDRGPGEARREDVNVRIAIPGGVLAYELVAERLDLDVLRRAIDDASRWWPDAVASFRGHQAHLRVSTTSSVLPPAHVGLMHGAGVAALLEELLQSGAAASGVVWNAEQVYPADFVVRHARGGSPLAPPPG